MTTSTPAAKTGWDIEAFFKGMGQKAEDLSDAFYDEMRQLSEGASILAAIVMAVVFYCSLRGFIDLDTTAQHSALVNKLQVEQSAAWTIIMLVDAAQLWMMVTARSTLSKIILFLLMAFNIWLNVMTITEVIPQIGDNPALNLIAAIVVAGVPQFFMVAVFLGEIALLPKLSASVGYMFGLVTGIKGYATAGKDRAPTDPYQ